MFVFCNRFLYFLRTKFGKFASTSERKNFAYSLRSIVRILNIGGFFTQLLLVLLEVRFLTQRLLVLLGVTDDQTTTPFSYLFSAWNARKSLSPCVSPPFYQNKIEFYQNKIEILLAIIIFGLWLDVLLSFIRTSFGNFSSAFKRENVLPLLVAIVIFSTVVLPLRFELTDDKPVNFPRLLPVRKYCKSPRAPPFCTEVTKILKLMIILVMLVRMRIFREKTVVILQPINNEDYDRLFQLQLKSRANFSELPDDVISNISNRLTSFEDLVALSGVCRSWRSACLNMRCGPRHQFPWLMLSDRENRSTKSSYSVGRNKIYELELPQAYGKRCHGSPYGWIVTMDPDLQAHLLHPLSQAQLSLPKLNIIRNPIGVLVPVDPFRFIRKCILVKTSPSHFQDEFLVVVIFGPKHSLAFAKPGSVGWTTVVGADGFKDILLFKGQIHAICDKGRLLRFRSDDPESTPRLIAYHPEDVSRVERIYLLESSGELLGVFRFSSSTPFLQRYDTKRFLVYKLDSDNDGNLGTWQRLSHLGGRALFVGEGNSWSVCTANILNCRSSCIYFTADIWDQQVRGEEQTLVGHDIGVFDMVSKKIERLELGPHSPCYQSRPVWFTPSLLP